MNTISLRLALAFGAYSALALANDPNLLPNGDFNGSTIGWTSPGAGAFEYDPSHNADGDIFSGAMKLTAVGDSLTTAHSACFGVAPGAPYRFGGMIWPITGSAFFDETCTVFGSDTCSGLGTELSTISNASYFAESGFTLPLVTGERNLPADARSVRCDVSIQDAHFLLDVPSVAADFDDLFFESRAPETSSVHLDGYMSGSWYNPAQPGQGFQLEFTDQNATLLAVWLTYAPDGSGPIWVYIQGPYDTTSNSVTAPAEIIGGGKFPPAFATTDLVHTAWGSITFTFEDCDHGTVSWNSTIPGYASGSMPISRLSHIAGTACAAH